MSIATVRDPVVLVCPPDPPLGPITEPYIKPPSPVVMICETDPPLSHSSSIPKIQQIKAECLWSGKKWEDPDFPAAASSIFFQNPPSVWPNIQWKRPREICADAQLFVDGASRLDVVQGALNNCWLVAAVACLTTNQTLLHKVIALDQSFDKGNHGVFQFQFWQYGRWVEVLIDDRLPTHDNKLIYMHSKDRHEFWSALLEKAYAKLHGSYEALANGLASEALTDFTGGIVDRHELKSNAPSHLFQIMLKAQKKGSLMGCTIIAPDGKLEEQLSNGLISGHSYSVTDVRTIQVKTTQGSEAIQMVRVRNPWGDSNEWKGAWSDGSQEWKAVTDDEKRSLGLVNEHDGEFWMSYKDFVSNFDRLEICYLGPDSLVKDEELKGTRKWESCSFDGAWHRRINAGGCRNYKSTFWTNPQYRVKVAGADSDDEDGNGSITIGLMQKQRRQMLKQGGGNLKIGYTVYQVPESQTTPISIHDKSFFDRPAVAKSKEFTDMREVTCNHKLSPGEYVIVPSTFDPNEEGEFILRVFSERQNDQAGELDQVTTTVDIQEHALGDKHPKEKHSKEMGRQQFRILAGDDGEIDTFELQDVLNTTFKKDFDFDGFTKDMARSMVAMHDSDFSGKLGYEQFKKLWKELLICERVFKAMDADGNGYFCSSEFRNALNTLGFRVNNSTFKLIVIRYSDREGHVRFDDFVNCYFELKTLFDSYKAIDSAGNGFPADLRDQTGDQNQDGSEVVRKAEVTGCHPHVHRPRCRNPYPKFGYNTGGGNTVNIGNKSGTNSGTVNVHIGPKYERKN
jgi:calpain, invertebrate